MREMLVQSGLLLTAQTIGQASDWRIHAAGGVRGDE